MRSEVMGKTLAIVMVIAMIATGIALLPTDTRAASGYTITGHLIDDVTGDDIGGVTVTITNATLSVNKNTTSASNGMFTLYVADRGDFNLTFQMDAYRTKTDMLLNATFNETTKSADMGIVLLVPLPTISGTLKETGTDTPISGVEVTIKNGTSGEVMDQVTTDTAGEFKYPVDASLVDLYYKKNGYYDNNDEDVVVALHGDTSVGDIYLEKIVPEPTVKVWGIVFEQGTTNTLSGALVSISSGNEKWITAVSDDQGYYEMLAYPDSFQIKASLTGYFTTFDTSHFFTVPADQPVREDIELEPTPVEDQTLTGTVTDSATTNPVPGADIYLHSEDGKYVNHTTTDGTGVYTMNFYANSSFTLEVRADGYFTNASATGITATATQDVEMDKIGKDHVLRGFVYDMENDDIIAGATVTIYSEHYLYSNTTTTSADNGYYEFTVHDGADFIMVVDADGYQSEVRKAEGITADRYLEVGLYPSGTDTVLTRFIFTDWSHLRVERFKTLAVDNISARADADRKYGMGPIGLSLNNWVLSQTERQAWENYLQQKGAEERDTADFLTLNNTYYKLNSTTYSVSVVGAEGDISTTNSTIFINSTYNYTIASDLPDQDSDMLMMVLNATYDNDYEDYRYEIVLNVDPLYEMTANATETNKVLVTGYNNPISVDPEASAGGSETVTMTLERSLNGTAKAKLVDGEHYYVVNSSYNNYTVMVAQGGTDGFDTTVTFSARDSTDPVGDIEKANFTWNFGDGTAGYGMEVEHNFTAAGDTTVTLTITETGGNVTTRDILVKVDGVKPTAGISVMAGDDNVTLDGSTLTVNEDMSLTFSGVAFTDVEGVDSSNIAGQTSIDEIVAGDGGMGTIEKWYWSWGEEDVPDETVTKDGSKNITHTYSTPGTYTLNMIATDVVGHESDNATWTVVVKDITAPEPGFQMEDEDGTVVTEVTENTTYIYNASITTDNFDSVDDLVFNWTFESADGNTTKLGTVVNYTFDLVGDFNVTLTVTDSAGNTGKTTQAVHVNLGERPNILMKVGSMVFNPASATAGTQVTISVNLTNDGKANATNIRVTFSVRNTDGTDTEIGSTVIDSLAVGDETTASITWKPSKKGEYSIWANATCQGEHSSQWWDNKIDDFSQQTLTVKEAGWVVPVIAVAVVGTIAAVFFVFRYFMQSGTESEKGGERRKKR